MKLIRVYITHERHMDPVADFVETQLRGDQRANIYIRENSPTAYIIGADEKTAERLLNGISKIVESMNQ